MFDEMSGGIYVAAFARMRVKFRGTLPAFWRMRLRIAHSVWGVENGQQAAHAAANTGVAVCAAIHVKHRAQLVLDPGVRLPSTRVPVAPVADDRLPGTPSRVRAARPAKATALRAAVGMPWTSVRSSKTGWSC